MHLTNGLCISRSAVYFIGNMGKRGNTLVFDKTRQNTFFSFHCRIFRIGWGFYSPACSPIAGVCIFNVIAVN